jgi:ferric-dicitrate binding protein FerR (iron transport regulator)
MQTDRLRYLLLRYLRHECTGSEAEELALWIDTIQNDEEWHSLLQETWMEFESSEELDTRRSEKLIEGILASRRPGVQSPIMRQAGKWWAIAAAVVVLIAVGSYIYYQGIHSPAHLAATASPAIEHDLPPGGNRAVLTLGNGQKIILDSARTGALASQGGVQVIKVDSGRLAYRSAAVSSAQHDPVAFNTLATPRGGQYQVILPDGSRVWLNAASSLTFPTVFRGAERRVTLHGEGYFEVSPATGGGTQALHPFHVTVVAPSGRTAEVKVLGTHFNINAYEDVPVIKATLLEGSIRVQAQGQPHSYTLSAGEQAILGPASTQINTGVNTDEVVAWKNGLFDFEGNDIASVMKQVARWYDVDVKYQKTTSQHFVGIISRSVNISGVLHLLEMTGAVHFKVTGNTITVL